MLDRMNQFIQDKEFRFIVYEDKIHVINYQKILVLEDDYVLLQSYHKRLSIRGSHLVLCKLLDQELLLTGTILKIEVEND